MKEKKIPVYKRKGEIFIPVGKIDEEIVKELVGDPDIVSIEAVYIFEEDDTEKSLEKHREEKKIHEFKTEEANI